MTPSPSTAAAAASWASVGVIVLTLNEESDVHRCLESLSWCDDLVVVDSGSSDTTCHIARSMGARVYEHRPPGTFLIADQRNWALDHCDLATDWVLFVDADEVITPNLAGEIRRRCTDAEGLEAFQLAPKYLFWGRWMKRCMAYPSWHDRLVRRGSLRLEGGVWEHVPTGTRLGRMVEPYLHYGNSKGFSDWLERHDRYSSWDASTVREFLEQGDPNALRTRRKLQLRRVAAYLWPARPILRFLLMYVLRGGFLDGPAALVFCLRYLVYEYMVVEKIAEQRRRRAGRPL